MQPKNNKYTKTIRTSYNVYDSGSLFLYMIIVPVILSVIYTVLMQIIANFAGITWDSFNALKSVKIINQFSVQMFFVLVFYYYNKKTNISVVKATHLKRNISIKKVLIVVLLSVITLIFISPIISVFDYIFTFINFNPSNEIPIPLNTIWQLLIALVSSALLPAIIEELVFRGAILNGFRKKFSENQAILFSAVLFMLMHGSLQQTVFQLLLGILLGLIFVITGNLIYPIIFHFVNNGTVLTLNYIANTTNMQSSEIVFGKLTDFLFPILLFILGVIIIFILLLELSGDSKKHLKNIFTGKKFSLNSIYAKQDNIILIATHEPEHESSVLVGEKAKPTTQIVVDSNPNKKGFASLTSRERLVLIVGVSIAALIWLSTTISLMSGI